jgi:hypothetical protein
MSFRLAFESVDPLLYTGSARSELLAACVFAFAARCSFSWPGWLLLVMVICLTGALAAVVEPVRLSGVFWASTAHLATLTAALALARAAQPADAASLGVETAAG